MPRVRVKDGDREEVREILGPVLTFGRAPDNHIILTDRECSRHHCYIEKVEQGCKMVDLESRNGTKANGNFRNQHLLRTGDLVTIGKSEILFIDENAPAPPRAVAQEADRTTGVMPKAPERASGPAPRAVERTGGVPTVQSPRVDVPRALAQTVTRPDAATWSAAPAGTGGRRAPRGVLEERARERRTMALVFGLAGAFILLLLVVFIVFLSSGMKNESQNANNLFAAAAKAEKEALATEDPDRRIQCLDEAITQYRAVKPSSEPAYTNARKRMEELGGLLKKAQQDSAMRKVLKEMQEIDQSLKSRQPPDAVGALTRYERLLEKVPKEHPFYADIQKRIAEIKAPRDKPSSGP
jgi:hypothetical protein